MSKQEIRIECMSEIFEELGIIATKEQIEKVVEDFSTHIEMEGELSSYQHIGHKEECSKCKNLEYKLNESERQNEVFRKSVMSRRKTDSVWIEGDSVMYSGR
jgi:predicted nucleic-acid-binding Zn-ribbon protein